MRRRALLLAVLLLAPLAGALPPEHWSWATFVGQRTLDRSVEPARATVSLRSPGDEWTVETESGQAWCVRGHTWRTGDRPGPLLGVPGVGDVEQPRKTLPESCFASLRTNGTWWLVWRRGVAVVDQGEGWFAAPTRVMAVPPPPDYG